MPVQDMGEIDATHAAASIYDSSWASGDAGNDGFGATVELPTEEDLLAGSKAATRRAIIKTLALFVACLCAGAGAAFFVTREVVKLEPPPPSPSLPPLAPMDCMAFQVPGNASAVCSKHCGACLNVSDASRSCPVGCACTATCTTQGLVAAVNHNGIPGVYMQSCSPPATAGEWSMPYVSPGEYCVDFDECSSAPCQNGGTCIGLGISLNSYHCTCPHGISGESCSQVEQVCTPGLCAHGGRCLQYPAMKADGSAKVDPGEFECDCSSTHNPTTSSPWSGDKCEASRHACTETGVHAPLCQNGGTCIDVQTVTGYTCACAGGWKGFSCTEAAHGSLTNYKDVTTVIPLADQADSAEENLHDHSISVTSADLNIMTDDHAGRVQQAVGLRFNNVTIKPGSSEIITHAFLSFKVREVNDASKEDVKVNINLQWHSNAPAFDPTKKGDVSSRVPAPCSDPCPTDAVSWSPPADHAVGDIVHTAGLESLITHLIRSEHQFPDGSTWQRGNSIVFLLTSAPDSGNGTRWYEAFNELTPTLTIKKLDLAHLEETIPNAHSCAASELSIQNGIHPLACYNHSTNAGVDVVVSPADTYESGISCTVACCDGFAPHGASGAALRAAYPDMNAVQYTCTDGAWADTDGKGPSVTCDVVHECEGNPCAHGTCSPSVVGVDVGDDGCPDLQHYSCQCGNSGFEGENCESNHDDCHVNGAPVCQNGASCVDGINQYTCHCPAGYNGDNCAVDIDECESSPCDNGGVCYDSHSDDYEIKPGAFKCICSGHYSGPQCEFETHECASHPCQHGGQCTEAEPHFSCTCNPGFANGGDHRCENNIDECASNPCKNGGACSDDNNSPAMPPDTFACNCTVGWHGDTCSSTDDVCSSSPCQNGASCVGSLDVDGSALYTCRCAIGFSGTHCSHANSRCNADHSSQETLCKNGGTCIDDETVAKFKFRCDCGNSGFHGRTCQTNTNDCVSNECTNGVGHRDGKVILDKDGTCVDGINKYTCQCHPGFAGPHCTQHDSICTNDSPCQNGGTCHDDASKPLGYTCTCDAAHHGDQCESALSLCDPNPCGKHDGADNVCTQHGDNYTCVCPIGEAIVTRNGAKTCAPCADGQMPNQLGDACKHCPSGKAGKGGTCTLCPDGQGPAPNPPADSSGPAARTICVACTSGTATAVPGTGICRACPDGHKPLPLAANSTFGSTGCMACVAEEAGSGGSCQKCPPGKQPHTDHTVCEFLPAPRMHLSMRVVLSTSLSPPRV